MIEVYKILKNRYDVDVKLLVHLQQLQGNVPKGHNLNLANTSCRYDLRKY